jgi:hypothetical protein
MMTAAYTHCVVFLNEARASDESLEHLFARVKAFSADDRAKLLAGTTLSGGGTGPDDPAWRVVPTQGDLSFEE